MAIDEHNNNLTSILSSTKDLTSIEDIFYYSTQNGLNISGPSVNESQVETCLLDSTVIIGLGDIKGIGSKTAQTIIKERDENGLYKNFQSFVLRTCDKGLNLQTLEMLIKSGSFDWTGNTRRYIYYLANYTTLLEDSRRIIQNLKQGQTSFLDIEHLSSEDLAHVDNFEKNYREWDEDYLNHSEEELFGFSLSASLKLQNTGVDMEVHHQAIELMEECSEVFEELAK